MARLKRITNAFDSSGVEEEFDFLGSVEDLVGQEVDYSAKWQVLLNGVVVPEGLWSVTYPTEMDVVLIHPLVSGNSGGGGQKDDKSALRMVALIGVSIASMGVGASLGAGGILSGIPAGATLTMGQTAIMIAGMTATNIIGGMLVNKLLPYPEAKDKNSKGLSIYGWNPTATQVQGIGIPLWYGHFKIKTGNIIASNRRYSFGTELNENATSSNNTLITELEMLISYGLGPWNNILSYYLIGASGKNYSLEPNFRLGYLGAPAQSAFEATNIYTTQTVSIGLPFLSNPTLGDEIQPNTITLTSSNANLVGINYSILFDSGAYLYDAYFGKYGGLTLSISISAKPSAADETQWSPILAEGIGTAASFAAGIHTVSIANKWTYGYYCPSGWVSYAESTNPLSNPPTTPPTFTNGVLLSSLMYWRYVAGTEVARDEALTPSTELDGKSVLYRINLDSHEPFLLNLNIPLLTTPDTIDIKLVVSAYRTGQTSNKPINFYISSTLQDAIESIFTSAGASYIYPRCVVSLVKINSSAELKDPIPVIEFEGRKVAVWNGTSWSFTYSNNPAWMCYDVLSQPLFADDIGSTTWTTTSPALRYEGLLPAQLDHISFKAWADFCDELVDKVPSGTEKRYTFNGGFDEISTLWEAALAIAGMSQAWLVWQGSEVTVKLDHTTAVTQLFSIGNYITDSVRETYLPITDRVTAIEVDYIDEGKNFESNKFAISESGYSDAQKKVSLQLRGCTSNSQAYRSAKFELLKNKHLKKTIEFQAPLNAITCTVGDVVEVQSSASKYALGGGRIKSVTSTTILTLDRAYTFVNLTPYVLRVVKQDGTLITASLINLNGTTDTITLTAPITVAALDTYALGTADLVVEAIRVLDISQSTDLLCTISGLQYVPEIYDYNDSDILPIVYTPVADMPAVTITGVTAYAYFDTSKVLRSTISVSITKPDSIYYKQAKVYYKLTSEDSGWTFAGLMPGTSFQFEVPLPSVSYDVAVVTVNTQDITMNILDAPTSTLISAITTLAAVSSFTATSQYLGVYLTWVHPNHASVDSYQIYKAPSNDRSLATLIYTGVENNTTVQLPSTGTFYFWIKAIDSLGNSGAWSPDGALAGIPGSGDLLTIGEFYEFSEPAPNPTSVSQPTFS